MRQPHSSTTTYSQPPLRSTVGQDVPPSVSRKPDRTAHSPSVQPGVQSSPPVGGEHCTTSADCSTGFVCFRARQRGGYKRGRCVVGDCGIDSDCGPDETCMSARSTTRCVTSGDQHENQRCDITISDPKRHCATGLLCVDGWCRLPCTISAATGSSCPNGAECVDSANGLACVQACDPTTCASGEQCVAVDHKAFCATQFGTCDNCSGAGVVCRTLSDESNRRVFRECDASCQDDSQCRNGFTCSDRLCLHECRTDSECGKFGKCSIDGTTHRGGCSRFDPNRAI